MMDHYEFALRQAIEEQRDRIKKASEWGEYQASRLEEALHLNELAALYCNRGEPETAIDFMLGCERSISNFVLVNGEHSIKSGQGKRGVDKRYNQENGYRDQKKRIQTYWLQYIEPSLSAPKAADQLIRKFPGLSFRKLAEYVREFKKSTP